MTNIKRNEVNFAVLATDVAALTIDGGSLKVLVTDADSVNFKGVATLPGGLVDAKETTLEAAKRILAECLISTNFYIEQLFTFDDPKRDPAGRVVSVAYLMLVPWNRAKDIAKGDARWETVNNLPKMAYDHNKVVATAIERLKGKLTYTNIILGLMPEEFTLTELQKSYEDILGKKIDKRNFRKKIMSLDLLVKLSKKRKDVSYRPAQLYGFKSKTISEVDIL